MFQQVVLLKLESIENMLKVQTELLNNVLENQSSKENPPDPSTSVFKFPRGYFPIETTEAVVALEDLILKNDSARTELVFHNNPYKLQINICLLIYGKQNSYLFAVLQINMLKPYCGDDLEESIKSVLRRLIDDEVLAEHTFKGKSVSKKSFTSYVSLVQVIFGKLFNFYFLVD